LPARIKNGIAINGNESIDWVIAIDTATKGNSSVMIRGTMAAIPNVKAMGTFINASRKKSTNIIMIISTFR
jgi:hypothetical protein